jgi:hypothetical protein
VAALHFATHARPVHFAHTEDLRPSRPTPQTGLKRLLCKTGINMYVSQMMQDAIGLPGVLIYNARDEDTFRLTACRHDITVTHRWDPVPPHSGCLP